MFNKSGSDSKSERERLSENDCERVSKRNIESEGWKLLQRESKKD